MPTPLSPSLFHIYTRSSVSSSWVERRKVLLIRDRTGVDVPTTLESPPTPVRDRVEGADRRSLPSLQTLSSVLVTCPSRYKP